MMTVFKLYHVHTTTRQRVYSIVFIYVVVLPFSRKLVTHISLLSIPVTLSINLHPDMMLYLALSLLLFRSLLYTTRVSHVMSAFHAPDDDLVTTISTSLESLSHPWKMRVLCVAEKPSIARSISQILSGGQFESVRTVPGTISAEIVSQCYMLATN